MIITGLRGVGKTVLLNAFEDTAIEHDWIAATHELDEDSSFPEAIARKLRKALLEGSLSASGLRSQALEPSR